MDPSRRKVEDALREVHHNLYNLMVQTTNHAGAATEDAMKKEIQTLTTNLKSLSRVAPSWDMQVTEGLVRMVEEGRNPDIHQREFVEKSWELNQRLKGRSEAYAQFRDILAKEFASAVPEVKEDVKKVVEASGGKLEG